MNEMQAVLTNFREKLESSKGIGPDGKLVYWIYKDLDGKNILLQDSAGYLGAGVNFSRDPGVTVEEVLQYATWWIMGDENTLRLEEAKDE